MIKNKDLQQLQTDFVDNFEQTNNWIIKNLIAQSDIRYFNNINIASLLLQEKIIDIKIRILDVPNICKSEYNNLNVRGYFSSGILCYFENKGFKLYAVEKDWIDIIMKKRNICLLFEFGQCRISKLWEYLQNNKYFIIVYSYNTIIIIKRGKKWSIENLNNIVQQNIYNKMKLEVRNW